MITQIKKSERPVFGQWIILATAGDGFFIADRFIYSFRIGDEVEKAKALEHALEDAAFQADKYQDAIYCVSEWIVKED